MAGTWEIVALSEGDAFDHCEARREVDGTEVRMILQDESWTVWASVSGVATDAVSLDIDDTVYSVEAQVTSDGTRLGLTRDGMEAVRNGTLATLGVGDTVAEIALNGTAAAALRVEDCTFNEGQPPEPVDLHTPAPVVEPAPGPGCPAGSSVASTGDGGETELSLTYEGPETPLQLYWVDPYGRLLPMPALLKPQGAGRRAGLRRPEFSGEGAGRQLSGGRASGGGPDRPRHSLTLIAGHTKNAPAHGQGVLLSSSERARFPLSRQAVTLRSPLLFNCFSCAPSVSMSSSATRGMMR